MKKRESKGRLADQFLREDVGNYYSKKKFEQINEKLRRVGLKKRSLKLQKLKNKTKSKKSLKIHK